MATFDKLDRPRRVVFDLKAIRMAERSLGTGLAKAIDEQAGPTFFVTMLWAGLSRVDRNLSYTDVEKMVEKAIRERKLTMYELHKFIFRELNRSGALSGYLQDDDEEEGEVPLAPPESSGSS